MTPCPERRILRKLLTEAWSEVRLREDWSPASLAVDAMVNLDEVETAVVRELLAEGRA